MSWTWKTSYGSYTRYPASGSTYQTNNGDKWLPPADYSVVAVAGVVYPDQVTGYSITFGGLNLGTPVTHLSAAGSGNWAFSFRQSDNPSWEGFAIGDYSWYCEVTTISGTYQSPTYTFSVVAAPAPGDPPEKATIGVPPDGYSSVSVAQPYCAWSPGVGTDTMDVYFDGEKVLSNTADERLDLNTLNGNGGYIPLTRDTTYTWRVDCKNADGITTGDTWSFTCSAIRAPLPSWANYPGKTLGPTDGGVPGTDYYWTSLNSAVTSKRLIAAAANAIWYEER